MFDNIYITIMQDNIGNIADWFDENVASEKQIIEERKKDKNYVVLPLSESISYMKTHPQKNYCMYGADSEVIKYLKDNGFDV